MMSDTKFFLTEAIMNKVLGQDEVDAPFARAFRRRDRKRTGYSPLMRKALSRFDLANQDRIIRGRMPVLEIVNDRFARLCTNALSNAVRKRVELNPISIDMTKFGEFMRSLPVPTSIKHFQDGALARQCDHNCRFRLVFALVENVFGGAGSQPRSKAVNLPASNRQWWTR